MKKVLCSIFLLLSFIVSSCDSNEDLLPSHDEQSISISRAEVRSYESGSDDVTTSLFEAGDMITVVGAAEESVVFVLSDNNEWLSLSQYSWVESPQTVYAYYGTSTSISDGDQMPDLLVAEIECNGEIPSGGELSFESDGAFQHATALVVVKISGWSEYVNPTVSLKDLHSVISLSNTGDYVIDSRYLYSVNLELTSSTNGVLTYQARVPAGDQLTPNIDSDYSLMINSVNAFEYLLDDSLVPAYFESGKSSSFSLAFDYTLP